jgi:hypothetical protein
MSTQKQTKRLTAVWLEPDFRLEIQSLADAEEPRASLSRMIRKLLGEALSARRGKK